MKTNPVIYLHGMGGTAAEAVHYRPLFPNRDVIGFDYRAQTPWEAREEFSSYFSPYRDTPVVLIANSIGAYFAMHADLEAAVAQAYFISPVVDMERLITARMAQAGVTEEALREKGHIEDLSWAYLCYVRDNPIAWKVPTHILYGERDDLTSLETVSRFAERIGASLCVMPDGAHWFHTPEQMAFLDRWIRRYAPLDGRVSHKG